MRTWRVLVEGIPRTKKNSSVLIGGRAILLPSEAWREWDRKCRVAVDRPDVALAVPVPLELADWTAWPWSWKKPKRRKKGAPPPKRAPDPKPATFVPRGVALNCRATFYRHANVGDSVGFYQGLADVLESHGIVDNDRQLVSWDGSRLRKDQGYPRVVLTLEEVLDDLFPLLPEEEPGDSEVGLGG